MAQFARTVVAVLCLPFVWALCVTFVDALSLSAGSGQGIFSAEAIALFAGMIVFVVAWTVLPNPVRLYVLGHELTHAVWGLAFGARVSRLKVRATGGSVSLTKSNVWITLAPYFFPFWTMVVVALALITRAVMHFACPGEPFPAPWLWMFAVGFTWCFHACFTIRSLMQTQPDVEEYGRIFSWTLILACNIAGVLVWIICTTDVSAMALARRLVANAAASYVAVARFGMWMWEILPVGGEGRG